ncbi:MAG: hypothetical protein ACJ76J_30570 [Thermoanaerobaculia bacterium]
MALPASMSNFHLPLPPELHEMLRTEAERSGQPATTLAREALLSWLIRRRDERLHEEISSWAAEHAGSDLDLDRDLENEGLEVFRAELSE